MYIQCTKKLLDKIAQPYGELPNPPESYFCWHASFFEDESGLLYVVMMNDASEGEIFFELDSFKDFPKRVLAEIKLDMHEADAKEEEIAAYLEAAGPIIFGPTSDRSQVAKLSGLTKRMKKFILMMEGLQDILADPSRREELLAAMDGMLDEQTYETLGEEDLKNEITPMVALDVELLLSGKKRVKRSFLVPLYSSFGTLHVILQIGFGWYDSHLHEFNLKQGSVTIGMNLEDMGLEPFDDILDEETTMLSDYIPAERQFEYLYDFGDGWEHIIKVGAITPMLGGPFARCTGGEGSTPPEDCGGMYGYDDLCAVLNDPKDERYEELLEWVGEDFDIGFDQEFINEELAELNFIPHPTRSV